jgi:ATPase subunit of ABC transporter with duplicated ATPase domains
VSHDREFIGGLANRIIELKSDGTIEDFTGTFDEYLASHPLIA